VLRTRVRAGIAAGIVLAVVFSALFTAVHSLESWIPSWAPVAGMPAPYTIRVPYSAYAQGGDAPGFSGAIDLGGAAPRGYAHRRIVVPRGTKLDLSNPDHRIALEYESTRHPGPPARVVGVALIYLTLSLLLASYARRFGGSHAKNLRTQIGLFVLMLGTMILGKAILLFTGLPEYWIPVAAVPLWLSLYLDQRTAFLVNVVLAFFVASLLQFDILLLVVFLVRGMGASLSLWNKKRPRQMLIAGAIAGIGSAILYTAALLLFDGRFDLAADLGRIDSTVIACVGGGVLAGILGLVLRDPVERLLGAVGRDRLLDLTDLEQPLLQKMSREAPGSWEHARAMANLAEAAASAIGADALLVRAGAYYHDLGKTIQPKYFVENLAPGEVSPHEELEPDVSADAIMAHVVQGTKILRDGGVPEPVVEFAYTHHGTQVVEYFWHKCLEHGNAKGLTEEAFRYPGMKPRTRETAILMLVDSIEAASRTIQPPELEKFEQMIQRVLFTKLKSGQLDEAGLSAGDLRTLVQRMSETLVNMFHGRIKYPWQKEQEKKDAEARAAKEKRAPTPAQGTGANVVRLPTPRDK
jgi:putative nucleotidyltransferase with HDIG domain